jgi:hypothetical protein
MAEHETGMYHCGADVGTMRRIVMSREHSEHRDGAGHEQRQKPVESSLGVLP